MRALEAGASVDTPPIIDTNAVFKLFAQQGLLGGILGSVLCIIPFLLANLKLFGVRNRWTIWSCFFIGLVIFDIIAAIMVAQITDKIECLRMGTVSNMGIWEAFNEPNFYGVFIFGALPILLSHFLTENVWNSYKNSRRDIVDADKNKKIEMLDKALLDLNLGKELLTKKVEEKEDTLKQKGEELERLEKALNTQQNNIESIFSELLKNIKAIYDDFITRITSGKIFTDEILNSVSTAYKSGYIEYLPELYAEREVANRVRQIEQVIENNR